MSRIQSEIFHRIFRPLTFDLPGLTGVACLAFLTGCSGLQKLADKPTGRNPASARLADTSAGRPIKVVHRNLESEPAAIQAVTDPGTNADKNAKDAAPATGMASVKKRLGTVRTVSHEDSDDLTIGNVQPKSWSTRAPRIEEDDTPIQLADAVTDDLATESGAAADTGAEDTSRRPQRLSDRLKIPEELPGAAVPPLRLPRVNPDDPQARRQAIDTLFPELSQPKIERENAAPPQSLSDFEAIALANNPKIAQAIADVDQANGRAVQAGLYPNPTVGYQGDTVGSGGTANYHGVFVSQTIKTRNKLGLAQYAARYDISNAQLRLRRTRVEVLTGVRTSYYQLLVARENLKIYEALVRFTDQAYRIQVEQLKGGQAAAYEPMQLRSLSTIARVEFSKSRTRYDAAWRQLAAAVSLPDLPLSEITEDAETPVPSLKYDQAVAYMLAAHPDLAAANNSVLQAHTNLELACVTPFPDVNFYSAIQRDFTDPNVKRTTFNMQVGLPVPLWDRNQGNIQSAQATVVRTSQESTRLRNDLVSQLAGAFQRFDSANIVVSQYRDEVIPDLSRVYRAVYERHQQEPDVVGFGDIVVAQQTLLQAISQYASALGDRWNALVDILNLMQVEDLASLTLAESEGVSAPTPEAPTPVAPAPE